MTTFSKCQKNQKQWCLTSRELKSLAQCLKSWILNKARIISEPDMFTRKSDVKFEIDDYTRPQMKVVAIEGEKSQVDKVYQMLVSDEQVSKHIL